MKPSIKDKINRFAAFSCRTQVAPTIAVVYTVSVILAFWSGLTGRDIVLGISLFLALSTILWAFLLGLSLLALRRWALGICSILAAPVGSFVFSLFASIAISFGPNDEMFKNVTIPPDLKYDLPLKPTYGPVDSHHPVDTATPLPLASNTMQLRNSFQWGIYELTARVNVDGPGRVILKPFEATTNTPLTVHQHSQRRGGHYGAYWTLTRASDTVLIDTITVYEGGWDWLYPARFEIWFSPEREPEQETKLFERTYLINGWQR